MSSSALNIFLQGFFLQASLILALGAQNIFVLNSGLKKERHLLVAGLSSLCDTLLIFIGVLGVASIFIQIPLLKISLGILGVIFLFYYGILKIKETKSGVAIDLEGSPKSEKKKVIMQTLGFSLLNPHVYLDTVVLIGGYSAKFHNLTERFYFGIGASVFSTIWFFSLVILASFSSRFLKNQIMMKTISLVSGLVLILLSYKLGLEVISWLK